LLVASRLPWLALDVSKNVAVRNHVKEQLVRCGRALNVCAELNIVLRILRSTDCRDSSLRQE